MQVIAITVLALFAVAHAGVLAPALVAAPAPVLLRTAPIVHAPVVHTVPVAKTIVPVAHSTAYVNRAPAARLAVPVVHASPVLTKTVLSPVAAAPVLIH